MTDYTPRKAWPTSRRAKLIGAGSITAVAVIAACLLLPGSRDKAWSRPPIPAVSVSAQPHESLASFSDGFGQATVIMALANTETLKIGYEQCPVGARVAWPSRYYCNPKVNFAAANTLRRGEPLRVLALSPTSIPSEAMQLANNIRPGSQVAVLVDDSTQDNRDHAAALGYALMLHHNLAGVFTYRTGSIADFIDKGRVTPFNGKNLGLAGALRTLSVQPFDRIVVVTNANLDSFQAPADTLPVIGYCITSACEPGMKRLVNSTGGNYVPAPAL